MVAKLEVLIVNACLKKPLPEWEGFVYWGQILRPLKS